MPLLRRRMTPAALAANRANARKCTGPRTRRGKAQCRLNALRHGQRSRLAEEYFRLWWQCYMTGPWQAPPPYNPAAMPLPWTGRPCSRKSLRDFLWRVTPYLPLCGRRSLRELKNWTSIERSAPPSSNQQKAGILRNPFFDEQNHQKPDSKGGRFAKGPQNSQNELATNPHSASAKIARVTADFTPNRAANVNQITPAPRSRRRIVRGGI